MLDNVICLVVGIVMGGFLFMWFVPVPAQINDEFHCTKYLQRVETADLCVQWTLKGAQE